MDWDVVCFMAVARWYRSFGRVSLWTREGGGVLSCLWCHFGPSRVGIAVFYYALNTVQEFVLWLDGICLYYSENALLRTKHVAIFEFSQWKKPSPVWLWKEPFQQHPLPNEYCHCVNAIQCENTKKWLRVLLCHTWVHFCTAKCVISIAQEEHFHGSITISQS